MRQLNLLLVDGRPFLDLTSYARTGPGQRGQFSRAQLAQIARTVRGTPEVMVKVSGGGKSAKAVAAHFAYIGRKEFQIETDDGEQIKGRDEVRELMDDWELEMDARENGQPLRGTSGRKPTKLVHNLVLSMPAGTSPAGVLRASQDFAREQFALKHRYALVLHTDQPHPHVHLVVRAMGEQGQRLNIRNATLREWRRDFARHLRTQGIEANATERVARGARPRKLDSIVHAMREGRSTHMRERAQAIAVQMQRRERPVESGRTALQQTRDAMVRQWQDLQARLRADGQGQLAHAVGEFARSMPRPRTDREWMAEGIMLARRRDSVRQAAPAGSGGVRSRLQLPELARDDR